MGIQDRDYWRERYNQQDRRDYSEKLRDLEQGEASAKPSRRFRIIEGVRFPSSTTGSRESKAADGFVGGLLIFGVVFLFGYVGYKLLTTF